MYEELAAENLPVEIRILGVNPAGHESGNATMCSGRDLPWLQETVGPSVWDEWGIAYRDVVVLDAANRAITIYNLTSRNLGIQEHYDALKSLLRDAAGR